MNVNSLLIESLPAPQRLALSYAPARVRPPTLSLFALDARLSAVLRARREPIAVQLKLAWWRETLTRLPRPSAGTEPVLDSLQSWHDPTCLRVLPDAWEMLLADELTPEAIGGFVAGRSEAFACLARELGASAPDDAAAAARLWSLADLAANVASAEERDLIIRLGRTLPPTVRLPASLRPLAVLAGLGARALQRGGAPLLDGPGSALVALRIGLTGR